MSLTKFYQLAFAVACIFYLRFVVSGFHTVEGREERFFSDQSRIRASLLHFDAADVVSFVAEPGGRDCGELLAKIPIILADKPVEISADGHYAGKPVFYYLRKSDSVARVLPGYMLIDSLQIENYLIHIYKMK